MNFENSQRGNAGAKLVIVLLVLFLIGNAGYNYVPVAYNGENLKQEIQAAVTQAVTIPPSTGTPLDYAKRRLLTVAKANGAPDDAYIEVKQVNGGLLQARVAFTKEVSLLPFGIYNYKYQFDHSANTNGYLAKQ
jgi:hypothetical protein